MVLVVDDALVLTVRAGNPAAELNDARTRGELFTIGGWYYRLARASQQSVAPSRPRPTRSRRLPSDGLSLASAGGEAPLLMRRRAPFVSTPRAGARSAG
jgi:hypothetical protein